MVLKSSVDFFVETEIYKKPEEVNKFLSDFALRGSSVDFARNRAFWMSSDDKILK